MTNKLTPAAVLSRIEDVAPSLKVHLDYHNVTEADASRIVRVFPKTAEISASNAAGEMIRIVVNETLHVNLFLRDSYRPIPRPSSTPISDRILAEAGIR